MTEQFQRQLKKPAHTATRQQNAPDRTVRTVHALIVALLTFTISVAAPPVCAAPSLSAEEVLAAVGIASTDVQPLLEGEILSYSVAEPTDKTLANGVVMYVKAAPGRVVGAIRRGALLARDPDMLAQGEVPKSAGPETFKRFSFSGRQADEVANLLKVQPGSEFNFSPQEITRFQAFIKGLDAKSADAIAKAVTQHYRTILLERMQSYQKAGLSGIAPYAREGGTVADAGTELRIFTDQDPLLKLFAPALRTALLRYPATLPSATRSHFLWLNRRVQGRPTAILNHRLIHTFDDAALIVQNEFYAGHSFNVGQLVIGMVRHRGGTLVLYTHRSSSDQVAGIGQSLKHTIGRKALQEEMTKRLQRLRASLPKG